jgi:hypothetical protein
VGPAFLALQDAFLGQSARGIADCRGSMADWMHTLSRSHPGAKQTAATVLAAVAPAPDAHPIVANPTVPDAAYAASNNTGIPTFSQAVVDAGARYAWTDGGSGTVAVDRVLYAGQLEGAYEDRGSAEREVRREFVASPEAAVKKSAGRSGRTGVAIARAGEARRRRARVEGGVAAGAICPWRRQRVGGRAS